GRRDEARRARPTEGGRDRRLREAAPGADRPAGDAGALAANARERGAARRADAGAVRRRARAPEVLDRGRDLVDTATRAEARRSGRARATASRRGGAPSGASRVAGRSGTRRAGRAANGRTVPGVARVAALRAGRYRARRRAPAEAARGR